jgi:hypothetical protein
MQSLTLFQNEFQNVGGLSAQGHSHTDVMDLLTDRIGNDSVDAYRGKQQCHAAKIVINKPGNRRMNAAGDVLTTSSIVRTPKIATLGSNARVCSRMGPAMLAGSVLVLTTIVVKGEPLCRNG